MNERIKTISRYYKALEYEINKQEALKKISILHKKLKFKDTNDFSNRFLQAASIIEENISIFKSACNHVDVVTTILDFLHTISVEMMFDNESCSFEEIKIIYFMSITCEEHEIPSFLKAALIDNSRLEYVNKIYMTLFSSYVFDMIVLEDSDLYAVISYLKITPFLLLNLRKILVQEPIKHKFLWLIEKNFKNLYTCSALPIFVFHTKKELEMNLESFDCMNFISIWSQNIITAKTIAAASHRNITFINAHLEFSSNIQFTSKIKPGTFNLVKLSYFMLCDKPKDIINPNELDKHSVYDLFYDGIWQKPVKNTYWMHYGNAYAYATTEDILRCLKSTEKAMSSWGTHSIDFRREILKNLASTLECNGHLLLASIVLQWIKLSNVSNVLVCQDERLEIARIHGPKGVVSIFHNNEVILFGYLTLALLLGNCVIVLDKGRNSCIAQYFNMFATAEIPPGVINLLSNKDMFPDIDPFCVYEVKDLHMYCTSVNNVILCLK